MQLNNDKCILNFSIHLFKFNTTKTKMNPIYLDCNSTTPIEKEVIEVMKVYLEEDYGNAGSRTHIYGLNANRAIEQARKEIAGVIDCEPNEVFFTSGATESNNIALLGLSEYGKSKNKRHIISAKIEHKAVLEPLERLEKNGFEITYIECDKSGRISVEEVLDNIRPNTLLVSIMHVNNETGIKQPISEIAEELRSSDIFFHSDAAQGFGKDIDTLKNSAIDLISISGHKIYGPKGIGALVCRSTKKVAGAIEPIMIGGGQERGIRPGTHPVHLIAGLGEAARISMRDNQKRNSNNEIFKNELITKFDQLEIIIYGSQEYCLPNTLNLSFGGLDSEAIILCLKDEVAISNGSACTSDSYEASHVIRAMGFSDDEAETATRWSWSHLTPKPDWDNILSNLKKLY